LWRQSRAALWSTNNLFFFAFLADAANWPKWAIVNVKSIKRADGQWWDEDRLKSYRLILHRVSSQVSAPWFSLR
jgi:hypothetical protein